MVRRLLSSIVITAAAISVVGSAAAAAATENVAESSKVEKDVHQKAQVDDIDTSSTKVEALSTPKAAEEKRNNAESELKVDDDTATSTAESPWTIFEVPSWLLKTRNFYKIDKSSSNDGKWSTIANAQVCSKFGTSSIHVTLYEKKKNRSSLMINYRSDVFDDTTSTSGDYWYLTIVDGDDTTKVAVSVGKRHSYKLQKITINGEKVSLLTFRGVVGDGRGISSSTKSLLREGLKAASDMNIFSTLPGDGKMGDMYDKFVNDLISEDTSGMGGSEGEGLTRNTTDKKVCEESLDLKSDSEQEN